MTTIYKYPLNELLFGYGTFKIELPAEAKVLSIQFQENKYGMNIPVMWCQVDTEKPKIVYTFFIASTGENLSDFIGRINEELYYLGTFVIGQEVKHLFARVDEAMITHPLTKVV